MKPQDYNRHIEKEKFEFAQIEERITDKKLETKPIGYFKDAMIRFSRNKASVVASYIILILVLYALFVPVFFTTDYVKAYQVDVSKGEGGSDQATLNYEFLLPKLRVLEGTGIWDGTKVVEASKTTYAKYRAMEEETGNTVITKVIDEYEVESGGEISTMYKLRIDTYYQNGMITRTVDKAEFEALQKWQDETGLQVIYPQVKTDFRDDNVWYECTQRGTPKYNAAGELVPAYLTSSTDGYHSTRIEGDPGNYMYAKLTGREGSYNYVIRVDSYNYFRFRYGDEPSFIFGTTREGYDIFTRLANAARFSFMLAICISIINLTIGAIYGSIEGYFGGAVDLIMERFSDILSGVPFMVVTVLFQMHMAQKVGVVGALVFAFILTGWIGMASSTRMQFYRFKGHEYVLAARTLGAGDFRLMYKHIFPNALGTLITSCVLVIPGVIFSETSLTYLGIINLDSAARSSVGSLLSAGQGFMQDFPHVILFPALFIGLLEISFNLFGNGLRDAFNPSLRGSEE